MFDLSDLTNDLNEFKKFYKSSSVKYNANERPENPFYKNFYNTINYSKDTERKRLSFDQKEM